MYSESLVTNCSKITEVCCPEIEISSVNANNESFYKEHAKESFGVYKPIGMLNGRYLYQKENQDWFLEYNNKYWIVSAGGAIRYGRIHHRGGSVCPEQTKNEWRIQNTDDWSWKDDPEVKITCIQSAGYTPGHVLQSDAQAAIVLGCLLLLLLAMMCIYFGRRGYRAWGRGAHGKNLLFETFDLPQEERII